MSSGSVCSILFAVSFAFLPLAFLLLADLDAAPGRLILPPFVTGAKISFEISFCDFSDGVKKSILNASFFSRRGFKPVVSAETSAIRVNVSQIKLL